MNEALALLDGRFGEIYSVSGDRSLFDPTRAAAAGDAVAGLRLSAFRAPADGAARFDLLFRWFVGLGIDDAVWAASTFSKNRDRLLDGSVAARS